MYWWDIGISRTVYDIRLAFLVTNIALVGLVLWSSFWCLQTLANVVRRHTIVPYILDPQRCFGMQPYGVLLLMLIIPWFLALITAILGWYDHQGKQGLLNIVGTVCI